MSDCGCRPTKVETTEQRRILMIALALNAGMFLVGMTAGVIGQSSGLIADSFDMLTDAAAYALGLLALRRGPLFKVRAAGFTGLVLVALGVGVLLDVGRRALAGSEPVGLLMMAVATVSLAVNVTVLRMLGKVRGEGVHLNATWLCTRADVVANAGVILSGALLAATGFRWLDLIVGAAIGLYVIKEAVEILNEAKAAANEG
jgi:Co/Zn/Cd efflux system component